MTCSTIENSEWLSVYFAKRFDRLR